MNTPVPALGPALEPREDPAELPGKPVESRELSAFQDSSAGNSESVHLPVLASEIVEWLRPLPSQHLVDGTCGGGGHTLLLSSRLGSDGRILAMDRDATAVRRASSRFATNAGVEVVHASFGDLPVVMSERSSQPIDGVVLDLGMSSDQLADEERGFSFDASGDLDMRFDVSRGEPAWQLLERMREADLADLIFRYGEERHSRRIARRVAELRRTGSRWSARQFAELVRSCVPHGRHPRIDPATRTFQALRIAVNEELECLERFLRDLPPLLRAGGRVAIISFHSLEDRIVKWAFRNDDRWEILTRKPVTAPEKERLRNPRSRSAKLRVAERRP